jgi:uncharacterized membrane protein
MTVAERAGGRGRPALLVALALVGFAVSAYLAAFQLGVIAAPWDPVFGDGSRLVLTSAISRLLPVPDASIGAAAYAIDAVLGLALLARPEGPDEIPLALAVVAVGGATVALVLVVLQPLVAHSFCSLCLVSAACSVALAIGAVTEVRDRLLPEPSTHHRFEEAPE